MWNRQITMEKPLIASRKKSENPKKKKGIGAKTMDSVYQDKIAHDFSKGIIDMGRLDKLDTEEPPIRCTE